MNYLAIPHRTAQWLLDKKEYLQALGGELRRLSEADYLTKMVLSVGAFRATGSTDGRVLAAWNSDYLSNKGDESWGVIRLDGPHSLLADYSQEVFERELQIICQRMNGLLLDNRWAHKAQSEYIHSCIAGRGAEAREHWVMYGDRDITRGSAVSR